MEIPIGDVVTMSGPARKKATYQDLYGIPESMTGQIIDGELIATPRPSRKHGYATFALGSEIGPPYQSGHGGPGGWVFLVEPEIKLDQDLLVPDLVGWRKERFPTEEETNWIGVAPDWVLEMLSPGTVRTDRVHKMRIYARHEITHTWLIDPVAKTLEVFRLEAGRWVLMDAFSENEKVRAEPFQEIEIELGRLWL